MVGGGLESLSRAQPAGANMLIRKHRGGSGGPAEFRGCWCACNHDTAWQYHISTCMSWAVDIHPLLKHMQTPPLCAPRQDCL